MEVNLGKLLEQAIENNAKPRLGKVSRRTHKDMGFHVQLLSGKKLLTDTESAYLHTGATHKGLKENDDLIVIVTPSERVNDRLDVISYHHFKPTLLSSLTREQLELILPIVYSRLSNDDWEYLWCEWSERQDFDFSDLRKEMPSGAWYVLRKKVPDRLLLIKYIDQIEPDTNELWQYILKHHRMFSDSHKAAIRGYISNREEILLNLRSLSIATDDLAMALDYFIPSELAFWSFITDQWDLATSHTQDKVRSAIQVAGYIQAEFLLYLVNLAMRQSPYPLHQLSKDVDVLIRKLFDQHSLDQSRIRSTIFINCPVNPVFSACETSISPNKNAGKPDEYKGFGIQPDFHYWCRRKPCDTAACLMQESEAVSGGSFYKLVNKFFGYPKAYLHDQSNSAFIQPLAAINRWNELVERLHCHSCQQPLRISEHSPNSINKMAYAVTYWHCGNSSCTEYARSIKLSHCQGSGCDKIIDNRENRHSCTPWEVRSYKKMYLCTDCGSCCKKHTESDGFKMCPGCGSDNAYGEPPDSRGKMSCKYCSHRITVPWNKRQQVQSRFYQEKTNQKTNHEQSPAESTVFLLPIQFLDEAGDGFFSLSYPDEQPRLFVYDLFTCLKNGYVSTLSKYQKIYDIRLLERLHYLGKFHSRYSTGKTKLFGLLKHIGSIRSQNELDYFSGNVSSYISDLLEKTHENGVLAHYEHVELPFTLSLFSILNGGFKIDPKSLALKASELELARNISVESLRNKGIDAATRDDIRKWLASLDCDFEKENLLNRLDHIDFKLVRHLDPVFDAFYRVEKIERMGNSIKSVYELNGLILPDYQIIGTSTLRCTSHNPNLLGFPKQLRPVVKAPEGRCIVECDYGQMDVGVIAALSEDERLLEDYNNGDVYNVLANELVIERDHAKLIFLGILYGVSRKTLQLWLNKDASSVESLLNAFFSRYERLRYYQEELILKGDTRGYAEAVNGLRRHTNKKTVLTPEIQNWQHNWFKNYPVQASAAIVFKRAIIEVANNIELPAFKLIAPLYDALIFEVPLEQKDYYTNLVCSAMKRAMTAYFPSLNVRVSVNDHDTSCWNGGLGVEDLKEVLQ